jgi:hypothetical protein
MRYSYLLLLFIFSSCDLFDKEEDIPSYIVVKDAELITSPGEGAPTQGIVDVHVFANESFVGTYELPARIPILASGNTRISLAGGIRNNGISSNRIIYPFYDFYREEVELIPGAMLALTPDSVIPFNYFPGALAFFIEDFEALGNIWEPENIEGIGISNINDQELVLSGSGSGRIVLTEDEPRISEVSSSGAWNLSDINPVQTAYLEMDYRVNNPLEIGIKVLDPEVRKVFALGVNPTDEWVKIYVELSNEIGQSRPNLFQIYLESEKITSDPEAVIYLDNIKLIYPD